MCTGVNHKDLITVHHEMAHIQYFISYRNKPKVFRDGANAGLFKIYMSKVVYSVLRNLFLPTIHINSFNFKIFVAFHEAIGDAIALSASTPKHLQTLGLIQKSVDDTAHDINFLFALALDKV